jgi:uncharacterized alkaline shock family protein YloU
MTELATDIPAQRTEEAVNPPASQPSTEDTAAGSTGDGAGAVQRAREIAADAAERVGEAADRVGEAVDRVGDAVDRAAAASGRAVTKAADRIRNNAELAADRGTTVIANEVVEKIAGMAARKVPGVYDLGGDVARVFSAVKERVGLGPTDDDQGVSVRLEGAAAVVRVTLVIEYGFVVHSVTEMVRAKVIGAVENLLGLEVTAVDIVVDDVHVPDDGPIGDDEARAAGYEA